MPYVGTFTASYSGSLTSTAFIIGKRGDTVPQKDSVFMANHMYIHQLDASITADSLGGGFKVRIEKYNDSTSTWSTTATYTVSAIPALQGLSLGKYPLGDPSSPNSYFRVLFAAVSSSNPPSDIHAELALLNT